MRWLLLAGFAGLSLASRLLGSPELEPAGSALLGLGLLILGGGLAGELAPRLRLPRITGYLLFGLCAGPHAASLVSTADVDLLRLFEELALGLIALTAGAEFRLAGIRRTWRPLVAVTASHTVGIMVAVAAGMWVLLAHDPFLGPLTVAQRLAAVSLLGVIAVAVSPSTTIAVLTELRARGELSETVLGVTILKDLVIILLFTWVNAMALAWVNATAVDVGVVVAVLGEIVLSLVVGGLLGLALGAYLRRVGLHVELLVVLLALVATEVGRTSILEHLLVCMAAGFVVRNVFPHSASDFLDALERSSPPVYTVFFALVGAELDARVFALVWAPALAFVVLRLLAVWLFTRVPASLAGSSPAVARRAWLGFVAQAGLSLGFAVRIDQELASFGHALATMVVAAVMVNQLVGPVLWARALWASGEAAEPPGG